jgi:hypothetical protein
MVLLSSAATVLTVAGVSLLASPTSADTFQASRLERSVG